MTPSPLDAKLHELFAIMDSDGDGYIIEDEALTVARSLSFNPPTFWKMLSKHDHNRDGKIAREEFDDAVKSGFLDVFKLSKSDLVQELEAAIAQLSVAMTAAGKPPTAATTRAPHFGRAALLESVISGAIAPLRGSWLVEHEASGGRLSRRQDLPPEAFFSADELTALVAALGEDFGLLFVALSYRWLSKDHPDPDGFHLKIIAGIARVYMAPNVHGPLRDGQFLGSPLSAAFESRGLGQADFALFWDFASLLQRPRADEAEDRLFVAGLKASNVWYGHEHTQCWMQTELPGDFAFPPHLAQTYIESGWCFVEAAISAGVKVGKRRLDLGLRASYDLPAQKQQVKALTCTYDVLEYVCAGAYQLHTQGRQQGAGRVPPLAPDEVRYLLEHEKKFTAGKADVEVVDGLYRAFFDGVARDATALNFSSLGWSGAEGRGLAAVLPRFSSLTALDLSDNGLGADGGAAIAESLQAHTALTSLSLLGCQLDETALARFFELKEATLAPSLVTLCGLAPGQTHLQLHESATDDPTTARLLASELRHSAITSIDLRRLPLCATDSMMTGPARPETAELLAALTSLPLVTARLLGCGMGSSAAALLSSIATLQTVDLSMNGLRAEQPVPAEMVEAPPGAVGGRLEVGMEGCTVKGFPGLGALHVSRMGDDGSVTLMDPSGFRALATALESVRSLTRLSVDRNELRDDGTIALCEALGKNARIELAALSVATNFFGADGARAVAALLAATPSLTALSLLGNSFDADAAALLLRGKSSHPRLRTLCGLDDVTATRLELPTNGSWWSLGAVGMSLLAPELEAMTQLTTADLADQNICGLQHADAEQSTLALHGSKFTSAAARELSQFIASSGSLTSLDLSSNFLCGTSDERRDMDHPGLEDLDDPAYFCPYRADALLPIAAAVGASRSLTTLTLTNNAIGYGETGFVDLNEGDVTSSSGSYELMEEVSYKGKPMLVSSTPFEYEGERLVKMTLPAVFAAIDAIGDALRRSSTLTHVDLSGNQLKHAWALRRAVEASPSLTELTLLANELDMSSAAELAAISREKRISMVGITPDLVEASLSGRGGAHRLTVAEGLLVAAALTFRLGLVALDVSSSKLCGVARSYDTGELEGRYTSEAALEIADAISAHPALTSANLSGNEISEATAEEIRMENIDAAAGDQMKAEIQAFSAAYRKDKYTPYIAGSLPGFLSLQTSYDALSAHYARYGPGKEALPEQLAGTITRNVVDAKKQIAQAVRKAERLAAAASSEE